VPPISTDQTIISHLNSLNTKRGPRHGLRQGLKCGGLNLIKNIRVCEGVIKFSCQQWPHVLYWHVDMKKIICYFPDRVFLIFTSQQK